MNTKTYARLSLLIPLLVWVLCLSLLILASAFLPDDLISGEPATPLAVAGMLIIFYVLGILFWFIPYLLVSIVLLILSFRSRVVVLKHAYALSPVAMAILIMIVVAISLSTSSDGTLRLSELASTYRDTLGASGLFGIITLICGYICVGLGFGIYKLLQYLGIVVLLESPGSISI